MTQPLPNVSVTTARNRCQRWTRRAEATASKRNPNQNLLAQRTANAEYWCWVEGQMEAQAAGQLVGAFDRAQPGGAQLPGSHMTAPPVRPVETHPAAIGTAVALVGLTIVGLGWALTR